MKVYTVKDLETFERDEHGRLICPSGDYTQIKSFGRRCRFGDGCVFGDNCLFGEWCIFRDTRSFGDNCIFGEDCDFEKNSNFENIADTIVGFISFIVAIVMSFVLLL